ncbi:MAG: hypothetical protein RR636_14740 [Clostridium sp.]
MGINTYVKGKGGTYSYFGIGEKYIGLISSSVNVDDESSNQIGKQAFIFTEYKSRV